MYAIRKLAEQKSCKFSLVCFNFRKSVSKMEFLMTGAYTNLNWIRLLCGAKRASVGDSEFVM
jgi:hypothetical protein